MAESASDPVFGGSPSQAEASRQSRVLLPSSHLYYAGGVCWAPPPLPTPTQPRESLPALLWPWPLAPGHPSVNTLPPHWGSDTDPAQPQWWQWYHQRTAQFCAHPLGGAILSPISQTKPKHAEAESPPGGTASRWQQRDLNLLSKVPLTDLGQGRHFSGFGHYCPLSPSPGQCPSACASG